MRADERSSLREEHYLNLTNHFLIGICFPLKSASSWRSWALMAPLKCKYKLKKIKATNELEDGCNQQQHTGSNILNCSTRWMRTQWRA